ncbi:xanthine dehydrogenase family protein subunit M [Aliihoeflea aestuarii]|jgi:xanthine dehydrogenase YagS FAD-binding subunit|uniref:FAD binding domain-containing protein n=1 Tax=Aliihoeflea aestuarii TaxID=453840 RepID=UPI0020945E46|nr:xanthine dehydrogenase family protein subunit M [Aliihoeflea aestuarii]MCO6392568.1 xanthine dehydrogenase family protein subunit M [Aliihoeflea aestuarii]
MKSFDLIQPATIDEALAAWQPGASWLGGGTNLVDLMKAGALQPDTVIDVNRLPGLREIETLSDGATRIGALVSNAELASDMEFARSFPAIAEAVLSGASGQLRNAATVAGNLMQRTRCAYFQDPNAACNRREPGSGCDARAGENANLAVLGWSDACIATSPSDLCVSLAALDAVVEIRGREGQREIAIADFHLLPGDTPERETALQPGELIVAVRLPAEARQFAANARYLKVRERTSFAFAVASCAAALQMEGGRISKARLALGAVAARPWRVAEAETLLAGHLPDTDLFARAADAALAGASPSGANAWKIELARRTVIRALTLAAAGTPARMPALPASPFGELAGELAHV